MYTHQTLAPRRLGHSCFPEVLGQRCKETVVRELGELSTDPEHFNSTDTPLMYVHATVKRPKLTLDAQISGCVASFQPEVPKLFPLGGPKLKDTCGTRAKSKVLQNTDALGWYCRSGRLQNLYLKY